MRTAFVALASLFSAISASSLAYLFFIEARETIRAARRRRAIRRNVSNHFAPTRYSAIPRAHGKTASEQGGASA